MIPKELLKKVRQIQIRTRKTVNDVLAGHYHSVFRGLGMEFEEVTQYHFGDDVRLIDWNVSARQGEPYIKKYREERELTVMLVVDASRSGFFGSSDVFKLDHAAELCAVLALSAVHSKDKVGLIMFSDDVELYVPAKKGTRHALRIIRDLLYHTPKGSGTDIAKALNFLNRVTVRKSVCFLVSDFLGTDFEPALRVARRRHDLIPIVVTDVREAELPNVGFVELEDLETGEAVLVDTASRRQRDRYARIMDRQVEERNAIFNRMDTPTIDICTDRSYIDPLVKFFRRREVRR